MSSLSDPGRNIHLLGSENQDKGLIESHWIPVQRKLIELPSYRLSHTHTRARTRTYARTHARTHICTYRFTQTYTHSDTHHTLHTFGQQHQDTPSDQTWTHIASHITHFKHKCTHARGNTHTRTPSLTHSHTKAAHSAHSNKNLLILSHLWGHSHLLDTCEHLRTTHYSMGMFDSVPSISL